VQWYNENPLTLIVGSHMNNLTRAVTFNCTLITFNYNSTAVEMAAVEMGVQQRIAFFSLLQVGFSHIPFTIFRCQVIGPLLLIIPSLLLRDPEDRSNPEEKSA